MEKSELDNLQTRLEEPGPNEVAFFDRLRAVGGSVGLDENGELVELPGPVFIDFEASGLSSKSWPIEVGIAWLDGRKVITQSKLIKPRSDWSMADWSSKSAEIHGIPRQEIEAADDADTVTHWLLEAVGRRVLVSDAPEFDQIWLDRLLGRQGPKIEDFDQLVWSAFSDDGLVNPGRLHRIYKALSQSETVHRAGDDAAKLCRAWRVGLKGGR